MCIRDSAEATEALARRDAQLIEQPRGLHLTDRRKRLQKLADAQRCLGAPRLTRRGKGAHWGEVAAAQALRHLGTRAARLDGSLIRCLSIHLGHRASRRPTLLSHST